MAKLNAANALEDVDHANELSRDIGQLFTKSHLSDVTLLVQSQSFHCHKVILASRSEYFNALFFGSMKEAGESSIELKDISAEAFQLLLVYIYTSKINFKDVKMELILDVFHVAHQFGFESLVKSLSLYLVSVLSISNAGIIFEKAVLYDEASLIDTCRNYINKNAEEIVNDESLAQLSMPTLEAILCQDAFDTKEVQIFQAVLKWIQRNEEPKEQYQQLLRTLHGISCEDLIQVVRPTKLIPDEVILNAIEEQMKYKKK